MRTAADLPDGVRELIIDGRAAWQERAGMPGAAEIGR
jgi:hypothetical protein